MDETKLPLKRIIFIVNPISGTQKKNRRCAEIEKHVSKELFDYRIVETQYAGHGGEIAASAAGEGVDVVVAVGGDGTVNEIAGALAGTGVELGIIPIGSGNGLARHLRIPVSFRKAIRIIEKGRHHVIDTATLNGKPFVSIAGVGFDAFVAREFSRSGKRGLLSYVKVAFEGYFTYKPRKYRMVIDGQEVVRRALLVSFANSSQFGNNTSIDPDARLDDGFIDVCIVTKIPYSKVFVIPPLLFLPKYDKSKYIEVIRAKEVQLTRKKGKYVHLDGEPVKMGKTLEMKIKPNSLKVIVP